MPTRKINGNTYSEFAVVAAEPIPVDLGGATVDLTNTQISVGEVEISNDNQSPVPISDAGGSISVDDGGGSVTVDGPLTDTELRASPIAVEVSEIPLPVDIATAPLQEAGNASIASLDSKTPALVDGRVPVDGSSVVQPVSDGGASLTIDDGGNSITVDGPLTDAELRATPVPVTLGEGALSIEGGVSVEGTAVTGVAQRTPTTTSVPGSAFSQLLLAQNANRKGLSISNISESKLYLSFSNPATLENCFIELQPGTFLLMDQQLITGNAIYAVWASSNGRAQVTEFV